MAVTVLTQANFHEKIKESKLPVLVDFYADWCGPCKRIAPLLAEISEEMADKVLVCKVNIDENPALAEEFTVMSIPYVVCFKDGKLVNKVIGAVPKEELIALIND
jgi:thioredoxin 1